MSWYLFDSLTLYKFWLCNSTYCKVKKQQQKKPWCAGTVLLSTCGLNKHHHCLFKWPLTKNISHSPAVGPVLNRCFSKHWQSTHSVTALHTLGRHMGQIKQGSEYRRAPAPGSAAPPMEPFSNSALPKRRPSISVGTCWGAAVEWQRLKGVVCKVSPPLNSRFKCKRLTKIWLNLSVTVLSANTFLSLWVSFLLRIRTWSNSFVFFCFFF